MPSRTKKCKKSKCNVDRTPLDLLALPRVSIITVLSHMNLRDLLKISRSSEQVKELIKTMKFNITLRKYENEIHFSYHDGTDSYFEILNVGKREQNWRNSLSEISTLFNTSFSSLHLETKEFDTTWEWIKKDQSGVKELKLTIKNAKNVQNDPEKTIKAILDNSELEQLKEFELDFETPEDFKFTEPFIFKNPPKELKIKNASWFTVQNLMDSKVETIYSIGEKITDEEINFLLNQWMNNVDCLSNLKSFHLSNINPDFKKRVAFKGFKVEDISLDIGPFAFRLTRGDFIFEGEDLTGLKIWKEPRIYDNHYVWRVHN